MSHPPLPVRVACTQPVGQKFPPHHSLDKAYVSPNRLQAALYDVPCLAEVAEDAWGLGMTINWLLTGGDDHIPGTTVRVLGAGGGTDSDRDSATPAGVSALAIATLNPGSGGRGGDGCSENRGSVKKIMIASIEASAMAEP